MGSTPYTGLDFVEIIHRDDLYPLIFCHLEIDGEIDVERFLQAIRDSCVIVPEVLYASDIRRARFVGVGFDALAVLKAGDQLAANGWGWDLENNPQLAVIIEQGGGRCRMRIGMSHILSDGSGFKQYLRLVSALYSGTPVESLLGTNERFLPAALRDMEVGEPDEREMAARSVPVPPFPFEDAPRTSDLAQHCLAVRIEALEMCQIKERIAGKRATLNDAFLAAYARVAARNTGCETLRLPCPADLRLLLPQTEAYSIANLSGMYTVPVSVLPDDSFDSTLAQVHGEMVSLKNHRRCLANIKTLDVLYGKVPRFLFAPIVKKGSAKLPISYTNIGVIDEKDVRFKGAEVNQCFVTGTYRYPPEFQLSISTFKGACTLNSTLRGDERRRLKALSILKAVKAELVSKG